MEATYRRKDSFAEMEPKADPPGTGYRSNGLEERSVQCLFLMSDRPYRAVLTHRRTDAHAAFLLLLLLLLPHKPSP
jgi:hypothetical protein